MIKKNEEILATPTTENKKEKVIQVDKTGGHKVLEIEKEDIYQEQKPQGATIGGGRIPKQPKNL